jgi:hypothetical protein
MIVLCEISSSTGKGAMMRGKAWLAVVVVGVCCFGLPLGEAREPEKAEARWITDLEQARKLARENGKPLFVVFRCEH